MQEYVINVAEIENLQTITDIDALEIIFTRAKSTIVNGEKVVLVRKAIDGSMQRFDEFSTLPDLEQYRKSVFKYL